MAENYGFMLIAWCFLLLLGACVLINAVIDLCARELRNWVAERRGANRAVHQGQIESGRTPR